MGDKSPKQKHKNEQRKQDTKAAGQRAAVAKAASQSSVTTPKKK
ncbi:MAG TPA: hypothetical protein VL137_17245 [Polyangiaceae bacterium]|nr:hypothetical protein [Polyangiaceae bacterium]